MKKLFLVAALSLGTMTAFAQDDNTAVNEEATAQTAQAQDGFSEIAASDLPEAVTEAVKNDYPGLEITKAFKNEENQYKLVVAKEDGATAELYADAEGNWIEK